MPGAEEGGYDTSGLNTKWVGVDLCLGEGGLVVLEPEEEVVLEGEGFDGSTDGRPEEKNPAVRTLVSDDFF